MKLINGSATLWYLLYFSLRRLKKKNLQLLMQGYDYSRAGNPTRECFEKCIASLENAKHGIQILLMCCSASGLAALATITHLLKADDHVVVCDDVYGGTNRYFSKVSTRFNLEISMVDVTDIEKLKLAIKSNTKMVWIETPTNPLLKLIDIQAVADVAHKHEGILVVVDNTFITPYFQNPLELGADIVTHSITKYINGHADVVMGFIATNNDIIHEKLRFLQNAMGAVPGPFSCYLALRGVKTLHLRMREHEKNAFEVARFLNTSPHVKKVVYPGLESHPQHELAKKQMSGFGGMVTFFINGDIETAKSFFKHSKIFTLAESLGGYESLAEHPALMTHASVPQNEREVLGISDSLIRLSVGLESGKDLIKDLDEALKAACA
ncbi:cystathionine gamma-lyase-like isoform X2 [Xenia sp. Carnegie-2017]|uniref:cystathionine gamma-lyase-like isoform X2 n=1 Tax=Xenia sp. Carnegie-2017 TaxID=2897299 RepID=UPI001F03D823|nr:cystathionine gamma-lyase-like isoform X2 [Xenia sp. Carnegie-2017]